MSPSQVMYVIINDLLCRRTTVYVYVCVWRSGMLWHLELYHRYLSSWDLVQVWLQSF